jgi:predicted PurR-regulated permease PerM
MTITITAFERSPDGGKGLARITPMIIGHRLTLNPLLVFLSVAFWALMWGAMGALLAVPLLISVVVANKHLCSYFAVRAS